MPRNTLKRWMPSPQKIRENRALSFLGVLLHDPNLFHLNRHSVSVAFFVGLFVAFIPVPMQVPIAALGALLFRCNLPISIALVWITNPITFPFIFYACYHFGARILQTPEKDFSFELSLEWFQYEFFSLWQPLILGCILASFFFGCSGYVTMQWVWRWQVVKRWEKRKLERLEAKKQAKAQKQQTKQ